MQNLVIYHLSWLFYTYKTNKHKSHNIVKIVDAVLFENDTVFSKHM